MRQVWIPRTGGPEVLEVSEAPDPVPNADEVRIRVERIGINFADILARLGLYPDAPKLPAVVGYEVAGTIDAVGPEVPEFKPGDAVLALTRFGGYSSVVCVPYRQVLWRPPGMSADDGAALPVNYLTAYQMLVASGRVRQGDRVLIHQAAGGVGLASLQICRIFGAETFGTASAAKHDALRKEGLQHAIDYRTQDFELVVRRLSGGHGMDLVLDPVGGESWAKSWNLLAPAGRLVLFGFSSMTQGEKRSLRRVVEALVATPWFKFNPLNLMNANRGIIGVNLGHLWHETAMLTGWLKEILSWYIQGQIRPHVDRVFPLDKAGEAHAYIQERRNFGKVLLAP